MTQLQDLEKRLGEEPKLEHMRILFSEEYVCIRILA